jgi:threonine synthase
VRPDTIARSLAIGNPADGPYVLDAVRRTGGAVADVSDDRGRGGHPAAGAAPRACSPRPRAGSPWRPTASWSRAGQLDPDAETVLLITATA